MSNKKVLSKIDLGKYKKPNPYKGDIIYDPMGMWNPDNRKSPVKIPGNSMATHGYGNIPLWVVPDNDPARMVYPNTGNHTFENSNSFTEYPQMEDGGDFIELELDEDEIEEYRKGGFIIEDIEDSDLIKAQDGGGKDKWGRPLGDKWYGFNPKTKKYENAAIGQSRVKPESWRTEEKFAYTAPQKQAAKKPETKQQKAEQEKFAYTATQKQAAKKPETKQQKAEQENFAKNFGVTGKSKAEVIQVKIKETQTALIAANKKRGLNTSKEDLDSVENAMWTYAGASRTGDSRKPDTMKEFTPRPDQSNFDRAKDIIYNPMTSFGYSVRGQDIPEHLQYRLDNGLEERNLLDMVVDVSLIGWVHTANNLYDKATDDIDGNFWTTDTALDLLDVVPTAKLLKPLKGLKKAGKFLTEKTAFLSPLSGFLEAELTQREIDKYRLGGYIVEEVSTSESNNEFQMGGTPSEAWQKATNTPWSEASKQGLTTGTAEDNLALLQRIKTGEFNVKNTTKSFVENNSNNIKKGVSLKNNIADAKDFNEAFSIARDNLGANKIFEWNGRKYGTNLKGETFLPTEEDLKVAGLDTKKTKESLVQQNNALDSPYINKKTVKLEKDGYESDAKVKKRTLEYNSLSNADRIIKFKQENSNGKSFVIVDKQKGLMHIYDASGKLISSSGVDLGEVKGDAQTVTKVKDVNKDGKIDAKEAQGKADFSLGNKQTGAGKYYISNIDNKGYGGLPILNMMNERQYAKFQKTGKIENVATSFHKGYVAEDNFYTYDKRPGAQYKKIKNEWYINLGKDTKGKYKKIDDPTGKRVEALEKGAVRGDRVSNGCVRCSKPTLDDLSHNLKNSSEVYILPEDKNNSFVYENGQLNFKANHKTPYYSYPGRPGKVYKKEGEQWSIESGGVFTKITDASRISTLNKEAINEGYSYYEDITGKVHKGQGVNKTINTLNYIPIKTNIKSELLPELGSTPFKQVQYQNKFATALSSSKQEVMKAAKINGDVYNELAKMAFGIFGTESNFAEEHSALGNLARAANKVWSPENNSSPDYQSKYNTYGTDEDFRSTGLTQLRWKELNADELTALKKVGVTSNKDTMDPTKAAIATVTILGIRYNQQLTGEQKQDVWKYLPTKWNTRANYAERVMNSSKALELRQQVKKDGGTTQQLTQEQAPINIQTSLPQFPQMQGKEIPQQKKGGFLEAELTQKEINKYISQGYTVEDVSENSLNKAQKGEQVPPTISFRGTPSYYTYNNNQYSKRGDEWFKLLNGMYEPFTAGNLDNRYEMLNRHAELADYNNLNEPIPLKYAESKKVLTKDNIKVLTDFPKKVISKPIVKDYSKLAKLKIEDTDFLKHLTLREGVKKLSYYDTKNHLTGGVGHELVGKEITKYPEGTAISKEQVNTWLRQDSRNAFEAAKKQAKELKIIDPKFVQALASVNFQLGTSWNKEHKNTWKLLIEGKYKEASAEAANSLWNKQTRVRVQDFQNSLRELKQGSSLEAELTQREIDKYRLGGYIVEEY